MVKKGINSAQIIAVALALPKEHPKRNNLIDFFNTALRHKGTLPQTKEQKFVGIVKDLKKEGLL